MVSQGINDIIRVSVAMLSEQTRAMLLRTLAGRAFLAAAAVKVLLAIVAAVVSLPRTLAVADALATVVLLVALIVFTVRLARAARKRLLWRVRRKLILSYIFIGVVPALLITAFFLLGGFLLFQNLSSYLFKDGYDALLDTVRVLAETSAIEISRSATVEEAAAGTLERRRGNMRDHYPELSFALVRTAPPPKGREAFGPLVIGPWRHVDPPARLPHWVMERRGFAGTLAMVPPDATDEAGLVLRAIAFLDGRAAGYAIVADLPVDAEVIEQLRDRTGIRAGDITIRRTDGASARPLLGRIRRAAGGLMTRGQPAQDGAPANETPVTATQGTSVAIVYFTDWQTGATGRAFVSMDVKARDLWNRIAASQPNLASNMSFADLMLFVFGVVATLLIIIQLVALTMGVALARSITGAVHELFAGTERIRHGDFSHRIEVKAQDQLGELAVSFNQMTESIEHLLQTEAEKKRLEEELRIAREIQMSLLPRGPLVVPGLEVTALCVPAREVGGDYFDFFPLGERRVAILIADVSGKGTSAALYMAELKGLLLSLSQRHQSPRELLMEVNRIIADNLDARSFITMTYAVFDLSSGRMTYCRAGHTPLIYLPSAGPRRGLAQSLQPGGLVVGLRIDGIEEKFAALLEEDTITLSRGDVFVLYTDGVSEAMNADGEMYGEARLRRIVEEHGHLRSAELRERILRDVEAFVGEADQHDDLTLILVKVADVGVPAVATAAEAAVL